MKAMRLKPTQSSFAVLGTSRSAQASLMVLSPGEATGELENEHPWAEQWLFVVSGNGSVRVPGRTVKLQKNSLVLIEKGELHQVKNSGREDLVTLSFYAPAAYNKDGEPQRPAPAKSKP